MSHRQAYFNPDESSAATASLGPTALAALEELYTGEDGFRVDAIEGLGMVASRTDGGRAHMVVGPFDGLLGIELWASPHWRNGQDEVEEVARLEPAPPETPAPDGVLTTLLDAVLDGDRVVLADPDEARRAALIAWVSYALPRPDAQRLTFTTFTSRPTEVRLAGTTPEHAHALDGTVIDATRPQPGTPSLYARVALELLERGTLSEATSGIEEADGLALAIAGGATDLLGPDDLPRALELITALAARGEAATAARAASAIPDGRSLLPAVVTETLPAPIVTEEPISLRELEASLDHPITLDELEAALEEPDDEQPMSLRELAETIEPLAIIDVEAEDITDAVVVEEEPSWPAADRAALNGWLGLHQVARRLAETEDSRVLAAAALRRILPLVTELPDEVPFVGVHAPTKPPADSLEQWIAAVEDDKGHSLAGGIGLGLLGLDETIDRRAAQVVVAEFGSESIQRALEEVGRQALLDPFIAIVAGLLADEVAADATKRPLLRALCRNHPGALEALRARATRHPSLAVTSAYLWATVDADPAKRSGAARTLLMLDPHSGDDVRVLWGDDGPTTAEQHVELLKTYREAVHPPPDYDVERAVECLMTKSLNDVDKGDPLGLALRHLPDHLELPGYCAWYAAAQRPGSSRGLDAWAQIAARALKARGAEVPYDRESELTSIAAEELIQPKTLTGYFEAIDRLRRAAGEQQFDSALVIALTSFLQQADDPTELLAIMFSIWSKAPDGGQELHDRVLAPAAQVYKRRQDEIRAHLGPKRQAEWDAFVDRHGRPRFARRLFSRRR